MNFKIHVYSNYMLQSSYFLFHLFKKYNVRTEKYSDWTLCVWPHELPYREDTHQATTKIKERKPPAPGTCPVLLPIQCAPSSSLLFFSSSFLSLHSLLLPSRPRPLRNPRGKGGGGGGNILRLFCLLAHSTWPQHDPWSQTCQDPDLSSSAH